MTAASLPTREQEQELHRRLLAGDKTAPSDLAEAYYVALLHYLRGKNAKDIPDGMIADAVGETWSSICKKPGSYDSAKSLWTYLRISAQRDLLNALAKDKRRRRHETTVADVEQSCGNGKIVREDEAEIAERHAKVERVRRELLPGVRAGLTDGEVRCLELHLGGERKTARFAEALGITERAPAEQRAMVKRTKDKLKNRIKRARRDHDAAP